MAHFLTVKMELSMTIRFVYFFVSLFVITVQLCGIVRQYRLLKRTKKVPNELHDFPINEDKFAKYRLYQMEALPLEAIKAIFLFLEFLALLFFDLFFWVWIFSDKIASAIWPSNENQLWKYLSFAVVCHISVGLFNFCVNSLMRFVRKKHSSKEEGQQTRSLLKSILMEIKSQLLTDFLVPLATLYVCKFMIDYAGLFYYVALSILFELYLWIPSIFYGYVGPLLFRKYELFKMHKCQLREKLENLCKQLDFNPEGIYISSDEVNILPCCQSLFFGSCYKRIFIDEMFIEDENFFVELYKHNGINYIPPNGLVEEENGVKLMEEEEKEENGESEVCSKKEMQNNKAGTNDFELKKLLMNRGKRNRIGAISQKEPSRIGENAENEGIVEEEWLTENEIVASVAQDIARTHVFRKMHFANRIYMHIGFICLLALLAFTFDQQWLMEPFESKQSGETNWLLALTCSLFLLYYPVLLFFALYSFISYWIAKKATIFLCRLGYAPSIRSFYVKVFCSDDIKPSISGTVDPSKEAQEKEMDDILGMQLMDPLYAFPSTGSNRRCFDEGITWKTINNWINNHQESNHQ